MMSSPRFRTCAHLFNLLALALWTLTPPAGHAASGTWTPTTPGTGPYSWSATANWSGGVVADGAGFTAFLANANLITGTQTIDLDISRILGGLRLGDNNTSDRQAYLLSTSNGSTLTFDNTPNNANATLVQVQTSAGDTISAPIVLNSSLDIINNANDRTLTLSGGISAGTAGLKTLNYTGYSPQALGTNPLASNTTTGTTTISGIISNGAGQVAVNVDNHSGGSLVLSGANTYTGGTTLNNGILVLNHVNALGTTGGLVINGGTLNSTAAGRITLANGTPVTLNNDFSFLGGTGLDIGGGAAVTMTKNIAVSTLGGQFSIYGNIGDGGNGYKLTKTGFGNLYLTGNNTYSGGVEVNAAVLITNSINNLGTGTRNVLLNYGSTLATLYSVTQATLNRLNTDSVGTLAIWAGSSSPNALDFSLLPNVRLGAAGGAATYSGALTPYGNTFRIGGGGGTLTVSGALTGAGRSLELGVRGAAVGNVTLSGNNTYDGPTTLLGPITLQLNGNTGRIADTSDLVFEGTANFIYDNTGATAAISETLGNLKFQSGDGTVLSTRTAAFDTTLTFAGISRSPGATGNINVSGTGSTTALNKVVLTNAPTAGTFINQGLFVGGSNYAAYDSGGYLRALAYGTDADTASATGSNALTTNANKHVNQTGAITAQSTASIKSLRVSSNYNTALASGATLTITDGGILKAGGNAATISGGTGITTGGATELVIRADLAADSLEISTSILASSTGGVTKSGLGTVILSGNNAYTGTTTVNNGTLRAIGTAALSNSDVTLLRGNLDLRTNSTTPNSNGTPENFNFGNDVTVTGDSTITVGNVSNNVLYANKTLQLGDLNIGGNTLTVTNNNGYGLEFTGTTTLNPGATGSTLFNLTTSRPSNLIQTLTLSGKVTGNSLITTRGAGTMQLTNATNDFVGNIHISGGVLAVSNDGALGNASNQVKLIDSTSSTFRALDTFSTSRSFTLGNTQAVANIIQVVGGKTFTLNSAFVSNNGFLKSDNGTFELNADNGTWGGDVLIHDGILKVSNSGALGSAAGFVQVSNQEAALHLNGGSAGLTINDSLVLMQSGINSTGALLGLAGSGTNTVTGSITLNGATFIGVETGGTLNLISTTPITGNVHVTTSGLLDNNFGFTLTGGGNGTLAAPIATGANSLTKFGTGTWTLTGSSTYTGATIVSNGSLILSGPEGKVGTGSAWQISPGATVVLDNTAGHLDNRLGTRGVNLGGNLTVIGDSSAPTVETITGSNLVFGNTAGVVTLDADASQSLTFQISGSINRNAQGTALFRGDNLGGIPGAGVATLKSNTAPTFVGQTGAAGTTTRGILPWALVDTTTTGLGVAFATYDAIRGIMALNAVAGEQVNYLQANTNVALTGSKGGLGALSINSLNLGSGGGLALQPMQILNIESGGLLAQAGNTGISGGLVSTTSNRELIVHALGDLNFGAVITGTSGGLTKTGAGTMTLGASNLYTGATTVNQGTLKLAGGDHPILPGQVLNVNTGGTVDLNGNTQMVGVLRSLGSSGGETAQTGGFITSTGGAATLATNMTSGATFAGRITGDITFIRSNANNLNLTGENSYTGATLINGGTTALRDGGRITDSSALDLQYGSLRFENYGLSDHADRLADDAAITMRGGTLSFLGRGGAMSAETVGSVTLAQGSNVITASAGSNNGNLMPQSATLTLSGLQRNAAAGATVNFGQSYNGTSSERLGILASSTGSSENIIVSGGLATTNNIIGPWAVVTNYFAYNAAEFAAYDTAGGVGALNATGFAGYDASTIPATSQTAQNIRVTASASAVVAAAGGNINSLNMVGSSTAPTLTLSFGAAGSVLNLTSGGLAVSLDSNITTYAPVIGSVQNEGRLTAGGTNPAAPVDLFLFYQNATLTNALTVNSAIIDNPTNNQAVRLVAWGGVFGQAPIVLASNLNSYTGGTVVNSQLLQIGNATSAGNLPAGGLVINGGTVTQVNGTIATQNVAFNGPAILNLIGTNTLNNLTFDNNGGGSTNPAINIATGGVLNLEGNIAVTSSNVGSTVTIAGGTLALGASSRTLDVAPISYNGENLSPDQAALNITSVITGTGVGLVKTGAGFLQLGGASTFTGGVNLQAGGIVFGAGSTGAAGAVTSGPLGTGTLTIGNNTAVSADGTARTIANATTVNGNFTMGVRGPTVSAALTLSGAMAWGSASNRTVTVNSVPTISQTISGQITGSGGITKEGIGTLALTGSNQTTLDWRAAGAITINNGTIRIANDNGLGMAPATATAGNIVLNGGAFSVGANVTLNANRGVALGSATGSGTGILDVVNAAETLTYAGVITDNGTGADNLLKSGAGTLLLNNASTYTGTTTIGAGTLTLGANGAINNSSRIAVNTGTTFNVNAVTGGYQLRSGQTLEGSGSITGAVTALSGSIIAPGNSLNRSTERLTFNTGLNLAIGSTLQLEITTASFTSTDNFGGNAYGTPGYTAYITANAAGQGVHDQLSVTGTLNQVDGAKIQVLGANFTPVNGQIFNLLDWTTAFNGSTNLGPASRDGSADGGFDLDLPDISSTGHFWDTSQFASLGVVVVVAYVVPEPSRLILLALGFFMIFGRRRRSKE